MGSGLKGKRTAQKMGVYNGLVPVQPKPVSIELNGARAEPPRGAAARSCQSRSGREYSVSECIRLQICDGFRLDNVIDLQRSTGAPQPSEWNSWTWKGIVWVLEGDVMM